ncbi:MAG: hypothetical protein JSV36_20850 [Anaerolineae bacterium]|nr:MAG: hypothetical protein JSV36_20850 [Anaerolineae bacterium]
MSENGLSLKGWSLRLLAIGLWALTSAVAFLEILTVREIVTRVYAYFAATSGSFLREYWGGQTVGIGAAVIMGVLCVGIIIAAGEYHLKHFGQPRSWRLFGWTIAFELSILVLALFI